jgi:hydrogenase maturation protease
MEIPREIRIYAMEVEDNQTFSETCSPFVEEAIPRVVEEIARIENFGRRGEIPSLRSLENRFVNQ